jgi:hypothetical protein
MKRLHSLVIGEEGGIDVPDDDDDDDDDDNDDDDDADLHDLYTHYDGVTQVRNSSASTNVY